MHAELLIQPALLYGFLLTLARVTGVIVFVPIPGFSAGPDASRIVLALALAVALAPAWPKLAIAAAPGAPALAAWGLAGAIAAETAFGLTVGLVIALLLEGLQLTAQVLGLQAGYSYASTVDPNTQADSTIFQLMAQLVAGMLFFAFGLDGEVLRGLARSLESSPSLVMAGPAWTRNALEPVVRLGAVIFSTGLQLAMPVLALLVLLDIAFAVLGRLRAQLQLLSLSFSIKMLTALVFFATALAIYPAIFERTAGIAIQALDRALNF